MKEYDVLIVGGGIAGVSIGYELATDNRVGLIDMEATLAFHTTGRSAATFLESYGGPAIRALTTGSREFLENPPKYFESDPLSPLPLLWIARQGRGELLAQMFEEVKVLVPSARLLDPADAEKANPTLRAGWTETGMMEPGAMEVDVHCLHQGYLHGLRDRGGEVATSTKITGAERKGDRWIIQTSNGEEISATTVVNAAGSWVDEVAEVMGAKPLGIMPLRRTLFGVSAPAGVTSSEIPLTGDFDSEFYVKPEGDGFLCSPSEETPQPPSDAKADELEIARAIDAINEATTLGIRSIRTSWAGLRNFVPDRTPVVGYDGDVEGLFWFAGQGGYGIQTCPGMSQTGASLLRGNGIPADIADRGLEEVMIAPTRPGISIPADH